LLLFIFVAGDTESRPIVGSVPTTAGSSFYIVHSEDSGAAVSAAGANIITQPTSDEAANVAEAKANGNESFYFIDNDQSISASANNSEEMAESVPAQGPGDTEAEVARHQQDEEMADETETSVKAVDIEESAPVPLTQSSSRSDPSSLLTSVRLVIGVFNLIVFCHYLFSGECLLLFSVLFNLPNFSE